MEKLKVIFDTDPGVDDATCLACAFYDKNIDIKLITTVAGNLPVNKTTRNTLLLLDLFNVDIPIARGQAKPLTRDPQDATFIHGPEGLGGFIPPKNVKHKIIKEGAVEAMYKVLKEGDGDIVPILLGPQTNMALLLFKHPDIIPKIPKIIFMGGSPYGINGFPKHISFNISSDPEAFRIICNSKIPLVMIPSDLGRNKAHITETHVKAINQINDAGRFLYQMYQTYWEPGYKDKRIAMNDTCAYVYAVAPQLFTTEKVDFEVDLVDMPGKTIVDFNKNGKSLICTQVDREKYLKFLEEKIHLFDNLKIKKSRK